MSTRICSLDDVGPDSAIRVDVDGHRLAVVRCGDDVYVIGDRCTHADISLSEGEVDCEAGTIECWKHGSTFRLDDGVPTVLPATKPTPTYQVTVTDGEIHVELEP
ncbi:MAG: non-heme iron oxygenase ferredoxin subunit [Acidimicrobiia bacterium]